MTFAFLLDLRARYCLFVCLLVRACLRGCARVCMLLNSSCTPLTAMLQWLGRWWSMRIWGRIIVHDGANIIQRSQTDFHVLHLVGNEDFLMLLCWRGWWRLYSFCNIISFHYWTLFMMIPINQSDMRVGRKSEFDLHCTFIHLLFVRHILNENVI